MDSVKDDGTWIHFKKKDFPKDVNKIFGPYKPGYDIYKTRNEAESYIQEVDMTNNMTMSMFDNDPNGRSEMLKHADRDEFIEDEKEEMASMYEHRVWKLVKREPGMNVLGSRWVYKTKRDPSGVVQRHKARIVAQGFKERPGIDFHETFSSTVKSTSVRLLLALVAYLDLNLNAIDIKTFFLYGILKEKVYMEQPAGYIELSKDWVCELDKSIYGLKQAPRCANEKLVEVLLALGFIQLASDCCMFKISDDGGNFMIIAIHVDDGLCGDNNAEYAAKIFKMIGDSFTLKITKDPKIFIGLEIERDREKGYLKIHQQSSINKLLNEMNMADCKSCPTPMVPGYELPDPRKVILNDEDRKIPFQNAVGSLIWLLMTRIDICFCVNVLCRYMASWNQDIFKILKRLLRYLRGTADMGLVYQRSESTDLSLKKIDNLPTLVEGWGDADFAGRTYDSKSTNGVILTFAKVPIEFCTRVEKSGVSDSTCQAEGKAAQQACHAIEWISGLMKELGIRGKGPVVLYQDNQSTIKLGTNPVMHKRSKHFRLTMHYIQFLVKHKAVKIEYKKTEEMMADILNKAHREELFGKLRKQCGMMQQTSREYM